MSDYLTQLLNRFEIRTPYPASAYQRDLLRSWARRHKMHFTAEKNKANFDITLTFINRGPYDMAQKRMSEAREYMESIGLKRV